LTQDEITQQDWRVSVYQSIAEIAQHEWDICAGSDEALLSHRHLQALEASGIAARNNGFDPCHVVLRDSNHRMVAAAPTYRKMHSKGELGIDLGLSLAHTRSVGPYYPKLQVEIPMMSFQGRRLLTHPDVDREQAISALLAALKNLASESGASSLQLGYIAPEEAAFASAAGFIVSSSNTYVWRFANETSFEGFLNSMISRRRSEILAERRSVAGGNLSFHVYRGDTIRTDLVAPFFELYQENFQRHRTLPWLNKEYFFSVFESLPDNVELSVSMDGDRWIGAVMSFLTASKAYVQYWGQSESVPFLHFEQVIYRTIERAYENGLLVLDFGPLGTHKAKRGLRAEAVHHAVWFANQSFDEVAALAFTQKSRAAETERLVSLERLPFAKCQ
jgi:uncharacterized protein